MPRDALEQGEQLFARTLVLGDPKVGKTTTLIKSAVAALGPGYVICGATDGHLASAKLETPTGWQYDVVKSQDAMDAAVKAYRKGVQEGRYKWGLLDDYNVFAARVEEDIVNQPGHKMTLLAQFRQVIVGYVLRLCDVKAHLFCSMHYFDVSGEDAEKEGKKGPGVVPLITGQAKRMIPAQFNQVVWMQKKRDGQRVFYCNPAGIWGIGSQGLPKGTDEIPADVGELLRLLGYMGPAAGGNTNVK